MTPIVWMLNPLVVTLTAKRSTAPPAIRSIDVPIAMSISFERSSVAEYPEFTRTNVRSTDVLVGFWGEPAQRADGPVKDAAEDSLERLREENAGAFPRDRRGRDRCGGDRCARRKRRLPIHRSERQSPRPYDLEAPARSDPKQLRRRLEA